MRSPLLLFFVAALSACAQTNRTGSTNQPPPGSGAATVQNFEKIRAEVIRNRRLICGRILNVFPDGLVVDSGYTNLDRAPLNRSWLVPGTAVAARPAGIAEGREPDCLCVGIVFLTDTPKLKRLEPKVYDYVIIEGYPAGQYSYHSVGTVHHTVRRYSAVLEKAMDWNLDAESRAPAHSSD